MSSPGAKVRKSVAMLDSLEKSAGLSEGGKRWLIEAVDPFHDLQLDPTGYPDSVNAGSCVSLVKLTTQISRPVGLSADENWDCHIYSLPWFQQQACFDYDTNGFQMVLPATNTSGTGNPMGGIGWSSVPSGTQTGYPLTTAQLSAGCDSNCLPVPDAFFAGQQRVVAAGFEVHNTTADLYKQGSVTVYRMPEPVQQDYTVTAKAIADLAPKASFTVRPRYAPPRLLSQASQFLGSRTWEAEDGAYAVLTLKTDELPIQLRSPSFPALVQQTDAGNKLTCAGYGGTVAQPYGVTNYVPIQEFNMSGAYFTGLSPQTTLTLNFNVFIERFPTASQPDLVSLTRPPPGFDPVALELYTHMLRSMPVAVPVAENGLGDWFASVVSAVAPYLEHGLSAIPHPYAQVGAQAARFAGKMAKNLLTASPSGGKPVLGVNVERLEEKSEKRKMKRRAKKAAAART